MLVALGWWHSRNVLNGDGLGCSQGIGQGCDRDMKSSGVGMLGSMWYGVCWG